MTPRRLISILFLASAVLLTAQTLCAQNVSDRQARKDRLEKEIAILDKQIRINSSKNADALARLSLLQSKIKARQSLVDESNRELDAINGRIAAKQKEIDLRQARLDTMTAYSGRLIRSAYKNRDTRVWYIYILASESVSQGLRRAAFFRNLSSTMAAQAAKIKAEKAELEKEKAALDVLAAEARTLRDYRIRELNSLKKEEKEAKNLSANLKRQKTKYQKELAAKRKQADALEREIRNAIKSAKSGGKSGSGKNKPKTQVDYTLAKQFVANKGKLPWPAEGALTGRFGKQYHPVFTRLRLPENNGINIAVSPDTPVKAVFDGTVAQISVLPGYHQCILIQHGDYFTLYSKMKDVKVKAGDKVTTGQAIGTVDTISGETVLHFEIWDDNTSPRDPEVWLRPR